MHDASHQPEVVREQPAIDPTHRRAINDRLRKARTGLICAALFPNPKTPSGPKPRPSVTTVKLPRSSAGKPPRRGVHIPLSGVAAIRANTRIHGRTVKGPKYQRPYIKRKDRK